MFYARVDNNTQWWLDVRVLLNHGYWKSMLLSCLYENVWLKRVVFLLSPMNKRNSQVGLTVIQQLCLQGKVTDKAGSVCVRMWRDSYVEMSATYMNKRETRLGLLHWFQIKWKLWVPALTLDPRMLNLPKCIGTASLMNNYKPLLFSSLNSGQGVWCPAANGCPRWPDAPEDWNMNNCLHRLGCCECTWMECLKPRTVLKLGRCYINTLGHVFPELRT